MKNLSFLLILSLCGFLGHSQLVGTNIQLSVPVPAFNNCLIKEKDPQTVFIYLPPTYYTDTLRRYPVIFYLPGYGDPGYYYNGYMDGLIRTGKIKEMIVVSPSGLSKMDGSFYINSPLTGNWDDFITIDLVNYIDINYRTIAKSSARAVSGHSMGGFSALNLPMLHPDVFCIGYGISPGLFSENGLSNSQILTSAAKKSYFDFVESIAGLTRTEAHQKYLKAVTSEFRTNGDEIFAWAYGSAFSADTTLMPPYLRYPFSKNGSQFVVDSANLKSFDNGFGNLREKVEKYKLNLEKLEAYVFDYGTNDELGWIPGGCRYFDQLLNDAGINHQCNSFVGTHGSHLSRRIKDFMLPLCSSTLEFDSIHFSNKGTLTGIKFYNQIELPLIDTISKTVHSVVRSTADMTRIIPEIYISPGAQIAPPSNVETDFTNGSVTYTIISEDGSKSENWTIVVTKETTSNSSYKWSNEIQTFPNPAHDQLNLIGNEQNIKVKITDIEGKIVLITTNLNNSPIDISSLERGIYLLFVTGKEVYHPIRFVKE